MDKKPSALDYGAFYRSAPGLFMLLKPDKNFTILDASESFLQATYSERAKVIGQGYFSAFPERGGSTDWGSALRASWDRVLQKKAPDRMKVHRREFGPGGAALGEKFWHPENLPVLSKEGEVLYICHRIDDVTEFERMNRLSSSNLAQRTDEDFAGEQGERVKAEAALSRSEEQLRQAHKMDAVGRLAGGVAHDFNNILSVILGYGGFMMERFNSEDPSLADLEQIMKAAQRAADLTRQLLAFSRQQVVVPQVLDLNGIVADMDKFVRRIVGEDVDFKTTAAGALEHVKADKSHLEQVLMNLVVNARDVMPAGGKLRIETANVVLDEAYAREHIDVKPGPHVMLSVSDTGAGMDAATKARIFEPFFTTKASGRGTGLGLSTVFGIVRQNGGSINVYSEAGLGSTFRIYFPACAEGVGIPAAPPLPAGGLAAKGVETVLLVEDDQQVRGLVRDILLANGYRVVEAKDGEHALAVSGAHEGPLSLLLTDLIMPGINGRQLAQKLAVFRPKLPVLFMSGYTEDVVTHHNFLEAGLELLQKPFMAPELLKRVRGILDAAAPKAAAQS